jgi:DegV family protein with EDD domain
MVRIITDTTSCLHPAIARRYNIPVIPQVINFGEESYLEGVDIDISTFMEKLRTSPKLPKTAAPPPELFAREFERLVPTGETILCIHPSIEVSGTVRSAQVAALDFPEADIRVIDTRFIASPLGVLVEQAAQWAEQGISADEIESCLQKMIDRGRIYFLVSTLEFLAKGGRIGGASALLGSLLQIKPILTFRNGRVNQFEKARTMRNALTRLKDLVADEIARDGQGFLTVMHAGVPEQGQALADDLAARLDLTCVPVFDMPPAIVTHGGPGILGVGFFTG